MQCACKVSNNSGKTIAKLTLFHAPGSALPGAFVPVLTAVNLADGATTPVAMAPQEHFTDDWWAMGVMFADDTTAYFLANDLLPYAECETPANGAAALIIGPQVEVGFACTIETFNNADFTNSDGNCDEQVVTQAQLNSESSLAKAVIELILKALGA